MTFPTQMFSGSQYRVVHSPEELATFESEGWSLDSKPGWLYLVHTAIEPEPEAPSDLSGASSTVSRMSATEYQEMTDPAAPSVPTPEPENTGAISPALQSAAKRQAAKRQAAKAEPSTEPAE